MIIVNCLTSTIKAIKEWKEDKIEHEKKWSTIIFRKSGNINAKYSRLTKVLYEKYLSY